MKPFRQRLGNVSLPIYRSPWAGKVRYEVRWHDGPRTVRKKFSVRARAEAYAREILTGLANGATSFLRLTARERDYAERLRDLLRAQGVTLERFFFQTEERFQQERIGLGNAPGVPELVAAFLARDSLKGYYRRDLELRLGRFARDFQVPVNALTPGMLREWLDGLRVAPRTWNNYRSAVVSLLRFARREDLAAAEALALRELPDVAPVIYTPRQMRTYLEGANASLQVCLALSAFAGIRTEEVSRMRWEQVRWESGYIFLPKGIVKGKAAQRKPRQIPLAKNLAEWLGPFRGETGRVCAYQDAQSLSGMKGALGRRLGLPWEGNALRRSWISYQLALTQDVGKVATWAGNSPKMIHEHYLDLVTPEAAREWFEIGPPELQNVFPFDREMIRHKIVPSGEVEIANG